MWVDRKAWDHVNHQLAQAYGTVAGLERSITALETTMDWMRVRLTQLEHERAMLIQHTLGVTIAVPSIEKAPPTKGTGTPRSDFGHPLHAMPSFDDVGDEEAARLGISWDPTDGSVRYAAKD
jgi:hypothetical protein